MNLLRIFILFAISRSVFSQTDEQRNILTTTKKVDGVYRTFKEFRTNSPSIVGQFKITRKEISLLNTQTGEYQVIEEPVWGACLNDSIYYFQEHPVTSRRLKFYKLKFLGRYCFFEDKGVSISPISGAGYVEIPHEFEFVVNINNGRSYELDKKMMRLILSKDPELLAAFENESSKYKVSEKYIMKFNERNRQDIKPISEVIN